MSLSRKSRIRRLKPVLFKLDFDIQLPFIQPFSIQNIALPYKRTCRYC